MANAPILVSGSTWGSITGTLTDQADLINYLAATYFPISAFASAFDTAFSAKNTDNLAEGPTNKYFTNGRAITALTGQNISLFANNVGYITSSALTPYALLAGASFTGPISATNLSGTNTGDQTLNSLLPSQTGNAGKALVTDGNNASWGSVSSLDLVSYTQYGGL